MSEHRLDMSWVLTRRSESRRSPDNKVPSWDDTYKDGWQAFTPKRWTLFTAKIFGFPLEKEDIVDAPVLPEHPEPVFVDVGENGHAVPFNIEECGNLEDMKSKVRKFVTTELRMAFVTHTATPLTPTRSCCWERKDKAYVARILQDVQRRNVYTM